MKIGREMGTEGQEAMVRSEGNWPMPRDWPFLVLQTPSNFLLMMFSLKTANFPEGIHLFAARGESEANLGGWISGLKEIPGGKKQKQAHYKYEVCIARENENVKSHLHNHDKLCHRLQVHM